MNARIEADAAGAKVSGSMTMDNAALLLAQGMAALDAGRTAFDLTDVTEVDSSGLALLFGWQRAAQAQGKSLSIINAPQTLRKLADVYDVAKLLSFA